LIHRDRHARFSGAPPLSLRTSPITGLRN